MTPSCVRRITYTSDYFKQMADLARKLLSAGKMYADDTGVERMRDERLRCVESAQRGMASSEALRVFEEMLGGSEVCDHLHAFA